MPVIWSAWIFPNLGDFYEIAENHYRITFDHGLLHYLEILGFVLEIYVWSKNIWGIILYVWVCLLIIKSLFFISWLFSFVVIYSRIVNLQIFLWLSLYIKEWSLLTTSLPLVSCWRCICSGIYDELDFCIKKVLNNCVS